MQGPLGWVRMRGCGSCTVEQYSYSRFLRERRKLLAHYKYRHSTVYVQHLHCTKSMTYQCSHGRLTQCILSGRPVAGNTTETATNAPTRDPSAEDLVSDRQCQQSAAIPTQTDSTVMIVAFSSFSLLLPFKGKLRYRSTGVRNMVMFMSASKSCYHRMSE